MDTRRAGRECDRTQTQLCTEFNMAALSNRTRAHWSHAMRVTIPLIFEPLAPNTHTHTHHILVHTYVRYVGFFCSDDRDYASEMKGKIPVPIEHANCIHIMDGYFDAEMTPSRAHSISLCEREGALCRRCYPDRKESNRHTHTLAHTASEVSAHSAQFNCLWRAASRELLRAPVSAAKCTQFVLQIHWM